MAEPQGDPRNEPNHPRFLPPLVGHKAAQAQLARAFASGKMHHAWLVTGPRGIGKATLAYRLAAHVLSASTNTDALEVDGTSQAAHWIAAQSHPDLFVLERAYDPKTKRLKSEISVEDSRRLLEFFSKTSGSAAWRVAIIDPVDDLNLASSNALLKMIEEPPPRSLLVLVCSFPGRLLRTIRSRCLTLDLKPLDAAQTEQVAARVAPELVAEAGEHLGPALQLSNGSPGQLMELLSSEGAKAFMTLQQAGSISPQLMVEIGNRLSQKGASFEDYELFGELLLKWVSATARSQALASSSTKLAEAFANIELSLQQSNALNLDRRQTVIGALTLMDKALQPG